MAKKLLETDQDKLNISQQDQATLDFQVSQILESLVTILDKEYKVETENLAKNLETFISNKKNQIKELLEKPKIKGLIMSAFENFIKENENFSEKAIAEARKIVEEILAGWKNKKKIKMEGKTENAEGNQEAPEKVKKSVKEKKNKKKNS